MRTELLTYLTANLSGTISVSQELPFEQGGNPLYLKNMRKVYIDEPFTEQDQLVPVLNGVDINQSITRIRGYLATDAKNRNVDLNSALTTLANARLGANITNSFRKEFDYTTTLDDDKIIYEFEYRYHTIV
jgi:hypothetical protein